MSYVPINVDAYTSAYSGALAGMAVSGWIIDPTSSRYAQVAGIAGAFAQAFDTVWNDATALNWLQFQAIESVCNEEFSGHAPGSLDSASLALASNWVVPATACAALVLEAEVYFASQGITPHTPGAGGGGNTNPAVDLTVYVRKGGSDSTGDGSFNKPFATINAACTLIRSFANASTTNRYTVIVGTGRYTEALVMSEWTFVVGDSCEGTRVTFTSFTLGADFTPNVDHRCGFQSMTISGGQTVDFNAVSSNQGKIRFDNVTFNDKWTFTAFSAINQCLFNDCFMFNGYNQNGMNIVCYGACAIQGNVAMNSINDGRNLPTLAAFIGCGMDSLTETWTASGGSNAVTSTFQGTGMTGVLTLNGTQATVAAGSNPIAFPGGVTLTGGAPDPRRNLTGSRGANAALATVCTQLQASGGYKDSTTV
jgi:hypothetical protein